MSRREFRIPVEGPRPLGATLMVAAACLTLDITGQVAPWAIALQVLYVGFSILRREAQPLAWQTSPGVLNSALLGALAAGAGYYVSGAGALIALAHFATLAQGLQLLDARARRSEFLLVTLALFQVVLASNLTDSVLFPPLLIVFLLSTVWTLLVHTLRAEALESADPLAAARVTTPGLLRTTIVASTLSVLLALMLFLILPRMQGSFVRGPGLGASVATSGFSDQVELGELGRIRSDPTVVLRIRTLEGTPPAADAAYWRGLAFDHFDGQRWSVQPVQRKRVPGIPELGMDLAFGPRGTLVQQIVREPVASGVMFSHGPPRHLVSSVSHVERDSTGGLYASGSQEHRIAYTIESSPRRWTDAELRRDVARAPRDERRRYLQLPELGDGVATLAREITAGAAHDADRARALERWLRREGRYSDTPPPLGDDSRSPVEIFLERGLEGHCEYFASAMVVLGRSLGLPMRMVTGFAGGTPNPIGGFVTISRANAHAWVEMHYADAGWVRYDPTPPDLRALAAAAATRSSWAQIQQVASAVELWWFRRVVDFDRSAQMRAVRSAWLAWRSFGERRRASPEAGAEPRRRPLDPTNWVDARALAVAVGVMAATFAIAALRQRRRRRATPLPGFYRDALRLLARRGHVRPSSTAPRAFARELVGALPPAAARAFADLTDAYLAERFGGRELHGRGRSQLHSLRQALSSS